MKTSATPGVDQWFARAPGLEPEVAGVKPSTVPGVDQRLTRARGLDPEVLP